LPCISVPAGTSGAALGPLISCCPFRKLPVLRVPNWGRRRHPTRTALGVQQDKVFCGELSAFLCTPDLARQIPFCVRGIDGHMALRSASGPIWSH
jgi:hypothetical protein